MKTNSTPGPWESVHQLDQSWEVISTAGPVGIPVAICGRCVTTDSQTASNARLIAAATDLLAACKLVRDAFKSARPYQLDDLGFDGAEDALTRIEAAIGKAEGGE